MDQIKYEIDIFWSEEDEGYIADVPDLKYCSAWGRPTKKLYERFESQWSCISKSSIRLAVRSPSRESARLPKTSGTGRTSAASP